MKENPKTILTDDEIVAIARNVLEQKTEDDKPAAWQLAEGVARAVEAAVLAKLAQQAPVLCINPKVVDPLTGKVKNGTGALTYSDRPDPAWSMPLYTHPAPQQADRQQIYDAATYASAMAVFMTRMDAEQPDADDKGVSGWLQDAEDRIRSRASQPLEKLISQADRQQVPDGWRELCRRLYVELFHCDQQMTSGKRPKWKQGETVRDVLADAKAALEAAAPEAPAQHPDDAAVDDFAQAMKYKLAAARHKGREGWQTCPPEELSRMLREHIDKGDPLDVANFCMFLWWLGHGIAAAPEAPAQAIAVDERAAFEAWVARVKPTYWRAEAWQTEAWAMWQSISAALAQKGGAA